MKLRVCCPNCGTAYNVPEDKVGASFPCNRCQETVTVVREKVTRSGERRMSSLLADGSTEVKAQDGYATLSDYKSHVARQKQAMSRQKPQPVIRIQSRFFGVVLGVIAIGIVLWILISVVLSLIPSERGAPQVPADKQTILRKGEQQEVDDQPRSDVVKITPAAAEVVQTPTPELRIHQRARTQEIVQTDNSSAPAAPIFAIHTSAGVALPQTLPTGTAVGFSLDYQWRSGSAAEEAVYIWQIEGQAGEPLQVRVNLSKPTGTLQGVSQFRPEHGPFRSRLVEFGSSESQPKPLSQWISME